MLKCADRMKVERQALDVLHDVLAEMREFNELG